MRKFRFVEPGDDGISPVEIFVTEEDIISTYWPYWKQRMIYLDKSPELITHENCIDDYIAVHWAEEV